MTPTASRPSDGTGDGAGPQMMTTGGQESALSQGVSWQRAGRASRCSEDADPDAGSRDAGRAARTSRRRTLLCHQDVLGPFDQRRDSSLAAPNIPIWTANVFIGLPSASEQNEHLFV